MSKNAITILIYHRHKLLDLIYYVFQPLGHHQVCTFTVGCTAHPYTDRCLGYNAIICVLVKMTHLKIVKLLQFLLNSKITFYHKYLFFLYIIFYCGAL
jgi:hypothetical protein